MSPLYLIFLLGAMASAQVLEQVGDIFPIQFRSNGSSDVVGKATPLGKSYVLYHPGATYIALRFSKLNLLTGDSIEVSDANGDQAYTLTGTGKGKGSAFWSQHIKGDTIVLNTLITSKSFTRSSVFMIDKYTAGYDTFSETICGSDDKVNAACYASSFPAEYGKSRAVARLLINGNSLCTGFLVSGSNHLLTNNHSPMCGSSNSQLAYKGAIFGGATLIKTSTDLDYSLVQINSGNPASLYGFLKLDDQPAAVGGQIYIPQHAGGMAKQMAVFSSDAADASDGFCHVNKVGTSGCSGSLGSNLFYYCDTEGGSSGSPVVSRSTNRVLGLHKCGGCASGNHATSAYLIRIQVSSFLPPLIAPAPAPTDPVPAPTAPTCLASNAKCTVGSKCCSGVCKSNRRCK